MPKILMPALSPTMESGTLAKWIVNEGDKVEIGDILAEIETDKAIMELESIYEGVIDKIIVSEGSQNIKVNEVIANILNEDTPQQESSEDTSMKAEKQLAKNQPNLAFKEIVNDIQSQEIKSTSIQKQSGRVFISPLAKRIAAENNVNIDQIEGSGPHGRIVKSDVENFVTINQKNQSTQQRSTFKPAAYLEVSVSQLRKSIASRMSEAKRDIPHFYLRRKIRVDKLINFRKELNETFNPNDRKISINDIIIKSSALALKDFPSCNLIYKNEKLFQSQTSDIAIAVAIEGGLITPIIKEAENKTLGEISVESKELARRAQGKKLTPEEYTGGSFSISNLGMLGIDNFDAIINPPQTSILSVGKIIKEPVVDLKTEQIVPGSTMSVNLSVDHRAIDGALGAKFLDRIAFYLESPLRIFH